MSLRRPYRDSWEQREYKRTARSHSPKPSWVPVRQHTPSPPETVLSSHNPGQYPAYFSPHVTKEYDSDDDYPERYALTPSPPQESSVSDPVDLVSQNADGSRTESAWASTTAVIDLTEEASDLSDATIRASSATSPQDKPDILSDIAQVHAPPVGSSSPGSRTSPPSRPISDPNNASNSNSNSSNSSTTIYPTDSASQIHSSSNSTTIPPSQSLPTLVPALPILSPSFPTHLLRPVPSLVTLLAQTAPVLGDPNSGPVHFGPSSPLKPTFEDATSRMRRKYEAYFDDGMSEHSILKEGTVGKGAVGRWERKVPKPSPGSAVGKGKGTSQRSEIPPQPASTTSTLRTRQYSICPTTRTRNLNILLYEQKISHGELLGLRLSGDARRDVIAIGGTGGDVGGSLLGGTVRGAGREGLGVDAGMVGLGPERGKGSTMRGLEKSSGMSSTGSGVAAGRGRESARHASMSAASSSAGYIGSLSSRVSRSGGPEGKGDGYGYDMHDRRYRAGDVGSVTETGRYGIGGMCLWRLVKVGALVDGVEHMAWWVVPDKACGGYF